MRNDRDSKDNTQHAERLAVHSSVEGRMITRRPCVRYIALCMYVTMQTSRLYANLFLKYLTYWKVNIRQNIVLFAFQMVERQICRMSTLAEKRESHISIDSFRHYEIFKNKDTLYIKNMLNILFFVFKINIIGQIIIAYFLCIH